jgi:hypothetical protein
VTNEQNVEGLLREAQAGELKRRLDADPDLAHDADDEKKRRNPPPPPQNRDGDGRFSPNWERMSGDEFGAQLGQRYGLSLH